MKERPDYRIARQRHLGEMLDHLESTEILTWEWRYDHDRSRATYVITVGDDDARTFDTRDTERLVLELCGQQDIIWEAVSHPGGVVQLKATLTRIAERQRR